MNIYRKIFTAITLVLAFGLAPVSGSGGVALPQAQLPGIQATSYGTAAASYQLKLPPGFAPSLGLAYGSAAGNGMIGLATAPATGKLVAELASHEPPHLDPAPYSLARFM